MGINLSLIRYFSSQQPFIDGFKFSQSWVTQTPSIWNTREDDLLDLDSNGWVKSLPMDEAGIQYTQVGTLLFRQQETYLPGRYVVLYEGEGTLTYRFDAQKNEALSTPGRDIIDVTPSNSGIFIGITETDPNQTGDYIRDIRVVPESQEFLATTTLFNPEFIEKIQPFKTLRYMDWMETNDSQQKDWADRPKPEDARYSEIGVPVEIMVELANETDTDAWFNMAHMATDDYVANFARYVKDNLEPDLKIYVEYSNEVWNGIFDQNQWVMDRAEQEFANSNLNFIDWYSRRTTEVVEIWENVFGADSERIIGVMGAQSANPYTGRTALDYRWSNTELSRSDTDIDAVAIAPYFGRYIGLPENRATLESWTQDSDGGLSKLFQEITQGGLLGNSPEGGALAQAYREIEAYNEIATEENVQLLAYEGGQHLAGVRGLENNQAIVDLFIAANRDPRMGNIYRDYLAQWSNLGGDVFVHYSDIRAHDKWGSWGVLESVYQDSSPKYDALVDFFQNPPERDPNILEGTPGQDIFTFERPLDTSGTSKTIINFSLGEDKIDVADLGIAEFETLQALISDDNNNNAVIKSSLQGLDFELKIQNVSKDSLTTSNFIFSTDTTTDRINGSEFVDDLFGGNGNDTIKGFSGNDRLFGEKNRDLLRGGNGDDFLDGGKGSDRLFGGADDDLLRGGEGNDFLQGNNGNDSLLGDSGKDTIKGGLGQDTLKGGDSNDRLIGGSQDDLLEGEKGKDILYGNNGNDTLDGGEGNDTINGGRGEDLYVFTSDVPFDKSVIGTDFIAGFSLTEDRISLGKSTFAALNNAVNAQLTNNNFAVVTRDSSVISNGAAIVYNKRNGRLFYNSPDNGTVYDGLFAVIQNSPDNLTAANFVVS